MTLKEFSENAVLNYETIIRVNGQACGKVEAASEEALIEQYRKLDTAIHNELARQYEALPEAEDGNT